MSVLVAVEKDGGVAVAADTQISDGPSVSPNMVKPGKVLRTPYGLIGSAGWAVYHTLMGRFFAKQGKVKLTDEAEIGATFVAFWRFLREEWHFVNDQAEKDESAPFAGMGAEFLVVNPSGLFVVAEHLSVSRYERFCAIGSGSDHAEGAAYVLYEQPLSAPEIARRAVEVACEFDRSCGGRIDVHELGRA